MGETDGSSRAARSAQPNIDTSERNPLNIHGRIAGVFNMGSQSEQSNKDENLVDLKAKCYYYL